MAESLVSGLLLTAFRRRASSKQPQPSSRLYIRQASSQISIVDEEDSEPEWAKYKIKETNMFTVDNYQQVH
uniref:Uncharacterized protein n=1 Tax=Oryza meridionalis TaxID=40149 RepID=A0A0E0EJV8_9ORYZ